MQYVSRFFHHDFFRFVLAQQDVGGADAHLQRAGEARAAYQLNRFAGTEAHCQQTLVQRSFSVDRDDGRGLAGNKGGKRYGRHDAAKNDDLPIIPQRTVFCNAIDRIIS